jgi:hypothetical protein
MWAGLINRFIRFIASLARRHFSFSQIASRRLKVNQNRRARSLTPCSSQPALNFLPPLTRFIFWALQSSVKKGKT